MTLAQDHPLLDRLRHEGVEVRAEEPVPMACPGSEEQIQAVLALAEEAEDAGTAEDATNEATDTGGDDDGGDADAGTDGSTTT